MFIDSDARAPGWTAAPTDAELDAALSQGQPTDLQRALKAVLGRLSPNLRAILETTPDGRLKVNCKKLPFYGLPDKDGRPRSGALLGLAVSCDALEGFAKAQDEELRLRGAAIWHLVGLDALDLVYPLTGASAPIHEFNERAGGIRREHVDEYLDFFCSFMHAEDGPFEVVKGLEDLHWGDWAPDTEMAAGKIAELQAKMFPSAKNDAEESAPTFGRLKAAIERRIQGELGVRALTPEEEQALIADGKTSTASDVPSSPAPAPAAASGESPPSSGSAWSERRVALLGYGRALFVATLRVDSTGSMDMLNDEPIKGAFRLPLGGYRFVAKFGRETLSPPVLIAEEPQLDPARPDETDLLAPARAHPLAQALRDPGGAQTSGAAHADAFERGEPVAIRDRYRKAGLNLQGQTLHRTIRFERVDFFEDVILNEATFEQSLVFVDCVFMGRLVAETVVVKGQLVIERCEFLRLAPPRRDDAEKTENAVNIQKAVIGGDLVVSRSTVDGVFQARGARVGGRAQILSTLVRPLHAIKTTETDEKKIEFPAESGVPARQSGLDLRDSRYGLGLEIGQYKPPAGLKRRAGGRSGATTVIGPIRADFSRIEGPVSIFGLVTTDFRSDLFEPGTPRLNLGWRSVNFGHARIAGGLRVWKTADQTGEGWHAGETVIGGDLELDDTRVEGPVDLRGVWIEGGLSLARAQVGTMRLAPVGHMAWRHDETTLDAIGDKAAYDLDPCLVIPRMAHGVRKHALWRNGRTWVGKDLILDNAVIDGDLDMRGLRLGGGVRGSGLTVKGRVGAGLFLDCAAFSWRPRQLTPDGLAQVESMLEATLDASWFPEDSPQRVHLEEQKDSCVFLGTHGHHAVTNDEVFCEGFQALRTKARSLTFRDSSILGGVTLGGALLGDAAPAAGSDEAVPRAIVLENVRIGGSLACSDWNIDRAFSIFKFGDSYETVQACLRTQQEREAGDAKPLSDAVVRARLLALLGDRTALRVTGDVELSNSTIDSYLDLTAIEVDGVVDVRDVKLNGDLRALCCAQEGGSRAARAAGDCGPIARLWAKASALTLEMVRCDGDLHLCGLKIDGPLKGHNLAVAGSTRLVWTECDPPLRAYVAGDIDFEGSTFTTLSVDGRWTTLQDGSQEGQSESPEGSGSLSLARAKIGRLDLTALPGGINLSAAEISYFGEKLGGGSLMRLLDRVKPHASDAYASIEGALRRQGRTDEADRVYKRMIAKETQASQKRARDEMRSRNVLGIFAWALGAILGLLKIVFWGLMTGYGVGRKRLFTMCALVGVAALALSAAPENRTAPPDGRTCIYDWGMTATIAVPVVSTIAGVDFGDVGDGGERPFRNDVGTRLALPCVLPLLPDGASLRLGGVSPTDLALLLNLLAWVVWPLFLLSLGGYIRRSS